jgi:hypothetical protein
VGCALHADVHASVAFFLLHDVFMRICMHATKQVHAALQGFLLQLWLQADSRVLFSDSSAPVCNRHLLLLLLCASCAAGQSLSSFCAL